MYGVDDRFWRFHGLGTTGPGGRDALISAALAAEIGADAGASVLVRLERPSAIPIESLHGRKDQGGRTIRTTVRAVLAAAEMGEFSLRPQQGAVRAIFLPLTRLQQDLDVQGRVNTLIVRGGGAGWAGWAGCESRGDSPSAFCSRGRWDHGACRRRRVAVESDAGLLDAARAKAVDDAAAALGMTARPVLTYLANRMRSGDREIPYSLVTAMDLQTVAPDVARAFPPPLAINAASSGGRAEARRARRRRPRSRGCRLRAGGASASLAGARGQRERTPPQSRSS